MRKPKTSPIGICQENGAFSMEKRRDMRAHACLKLCHRKEGAALFCNRSREKTGGSSGGGLQRNRFQSNIM